MKILLSAMLATSLLASASAFAQSPKDVADARTAAEHWMKLMDTEEFSAAWNASAEGMRKGVPKLAWNMLSSTVRMPLGALKSRSYKSSEIKPESISFEYLADYESSHNVRETVTTVHEKDGAWRVSGYNIHSDDKQAQK